MNGIFTASLRKELLLLLRDPHALAVLFVMPVVFILIMALALQDNFAELGGRGIAGEVLVEEDSPAATQLLALLHDNGSLDLDSENNPLFTLTLTTQLDDIIIGSIKAEPALRLRFAPELSVRERALVNAATQQAFFALNSAALGAQLGYDDNTIEQRLLKTGAIDTPRELGTGDTELPNATQQNVPAWLVFAMFFISIPISTSMITERQQKTLMRIRAIGVKPLVLYSAKLLPYLLINLAQLALMLCVGRYLLPALGGAALELDVSVAGLLLMAAAVSSAALGFAALVATVCSTVEQATIFSGIGCILLGATGGVMVPSFIMPPAMQTMTQFSPMGWGLQGFLDIMLRQQGPEAVLYEAGLLLGLGGILLVLALSIHNHRIH